MKELNYQYKIIEEKNINAKRILKVEDSIYNKIVFMELYNEVKSDDWDAGYKLEDEIREMKEQGVISNYFINDDYSSGVKYFYKIYDEFNFDNNLDENSEKIAENIVKEETKEYSPLESISNNTELDELGNNQDEDLIKTTGIGDVFNDTQHPKFQVLQESKNIEFEKNEEQEKLAEIEKIAQLKIEEAKNESEFLKLDQKNYNLKSLEEKKKASHSSYKINTSSKNQEEIERIKRMVNKPKSASYTPATSSYINQNKINKKKSSKIGFIFFLIIAGIIGNNVYKEFRATQTMGKIRHKFSLKDDYIKGIDYVKKRQYYTAERYLKTSCNLDKNKKACYKLATLYEQRKVYKSNANNLALDFYAKGCDLKDSLSCQKAGLISQNKLVDFNSAVKYYKLGCDLKKSFSCLKAGYVKEVKLKTVDNEVLNFYKKGCELGSSTACYNLGLIYQYEKIKGLKDLTKAKNLYEKSCKMGYNDACIKAKSKKTVKTKKENVTTNIKSGKELYNIGKSYQDKKDYFNANLMFTESCNKEFITACEFLGWNYENGYGNTKSITMAQKYYTKGCDKDSGYSCNKMAYYYESGIDLSKDINKARILYKKSCNLKYGLGCNNLAVIYENGIGVKADKRTSKYLYKKACKLGYKKACK